MKSVFVLMFVVTTVLYMVGNEWLERFRSPPKHKGPNTRVRRRPSPLEGVPFVNGASARSDHVRLRHCGDGVSCREYRSSHRSFIVKENKPYLFVHIPKNAGTWVRQMFPGMNGGHDHMTLRTMMKRFPHVTAACHTFAIVRNPWDRVVSMYNNHMNTDRMDMKGWGNHGKRILDKHNVRTFGDFVRMLHAHRSNIRALGEVVWERQTEFVTDSDGKLIVDQLIYIEEIGAQIEALKQDFEVTIPTPPGRINSSDTSDYRSYYASHELRDMVAEIYRSDIEMTKYVF